MLRACPLVTLFALFIALVNAHVTTNPAYGRASYWYTEFSVGHGCGAIATTELEVHLAQGIASISPQVIFGWDVTVTPNQDGTSVKWTASTPAHALPAHNLRRFGLNMKLPSAAAVGSSIYFPVNQRCGNTSNDWVEIPDGSGEHLPRPAPKVTITSGKSLQEDQIADLQRDLKQAQTDADAAGTVSIVAIAVAAVALLFNVVSCVSRSTNGGQQAVQQPEKQTSTSGDPPMKTVEEVA
mmetsp:Transcript_25030/g.27739  ORF Transcript_25030/g.27739 Transcript_25030/m.27739 type:complete len:239 (+) Transcript_25030:25-741(+)